jgi:hypothetical protein
VARLAPAAGVGRAVVGRAIVGRAVVGRGRVLVMFVAALEAAWV